MKVITLPNGKGVSLRCYVNSWKILKSIDPQQEVRGWEWYPVKAGQILMRISDGVHDRVNQRGGIIVQELKESRLRRLIKKHRSEA